MTEKRTFQQCFDDLRGIGDKLGMPIDEGVMLVVAALNMHEIATIQSCEGHLEWGYAYPWVEFQSAESALIDSLHEQEIAIQIEIEGMAQDQVPEERFTSMHALSERIETLVSQSMLKPVALLEQFYAQREEKIGDERLIAIGFGNGGRIQPQGGCLQAARSVEDRKYKLAAYQQEMQRFGEFVRNQT